jgi:predicted metal-binding protein
MTEECQARWEATEEQIETIIIPAMKNIAQQCAGYGEKLQCPPALLLSLKESHNERINTLFGR